MMAFQLREQIQEECTLETVRLREQRRCQNKTISGILGLRKSILKKQKRIKSMAIACETPLTNLQQLEMIKSQLGSFLVYHFRPLLAILKLHQGRRAETTLKVVACSQMRVAHHSTDAHVRASTK